MGVSESMLNSGLKLCECLNHLHINCKSAICSFDVDTKELSVDTLPTIDSRLGSKISHVKSGSSIASLNSEEEENPMTSFQTLPPPADFITSNEHNHPKVLINIK